MDDYQNMALEIVAQLGEAGRDVMRQAVERSEETGVGIAREIALNLQGKYPDGKLAGKRFDLQIEVRASCAVIEGDDDA